MAKVDKIQRILGQTESESLDFKREFTKNKIDLVHDILCLANSEIKSNRYLVYGIEEKDGKPVKTIGINREGDGYTGEQILNILKDSNFNRLPKLEFHTLFHHGKEIFVIEIIYTRGCRPYFLLKDKKGKRKEEGKEEDQKIIRAGIAYTRYGCTNTPVDSTPDEDKLSQMWLEKFNLDISPIDKFHMFTKSTEGWRRNGEHSLIYDPDPDYQIIASIDLDDKRKATESWMAFPDPSIYCGNINLKYRSQNLETINCFVVDGLRYIIPLPEIFRNSTDILDYRHLGYYLLENSLKANILKFTELLGFCRITFDDLSHKGYYLVEDLNELNRMQAHLSHKNKKDSVS